MELGNPFFEAVKVFFFLNFFVSWNVVSFYIFPHDTHGFSGSRPGCATVTSAWFHWPLKTFLDLLIELTLPGSGALRTALLQCPSSFLLGSSPSFL